MNITVTLDEAGRVAIPQELRDQLQVAPGDQLELEFEDEQLTLRPARLTSRLRREQGVWIFQGNSRISIGMVEDALSRVRAERDESEPMGRKLSWIRRFWLLRSTAIMNGNGQVSNYS